MRGDEKPAPTIKDVYLDIQAVAGRLTLGVDTEPSKVRLATPRHTPLDRREIHLSVEVAGDGFSLSLYFTGEQAAALADGLDETVPHFVRCDESLTAEEGTL